MRPLFTYADVSEIAYIAEDAGVVLSREQQSLAVQAVALLEAPAAWTDYDTYADEIDALVAATQDALLTTEIPPPENHMQSSFWLESRQVKRGVNDAGNAVAIVNNTSAYGNFYVNQEPPALNDQTHYMLFIEAGNYYLRHTWHRFTSCGILTIALLRLSDSTVVPTSITALDMRGATLFNQITEGTFTITEPGAHKLILAVNGTSLAGQYRHPHSNTYIWRQEVII